LPDRIAYTSAAMIALLCFFLTLLTSGAILDYLLNWVQGTAAYGFLQAYHMYVQPLSSRSS
jgi:uncharacterized membrane protein YjjP (DUF1212 family)